MPKIWCCNCQKDVSTELITGKEAYPHRVDLANLPFWQCQACKAFVGCHHKTKDRTRPLGCIPSPEIKKYRKQIHAVLDPLWKSGKYTRKELYSKLSGKLGRTYHTAQLKTVAEAASILKFLQHLASTSNDKINRLQSHN